MNLDTSLLLYLESGTMIRSGTSLLLGIGYTIVLILLFVFMLHDPGILYRGLCIIVLLGLF
jgi:uncharacterized membrane protein